VIRTRSGPGRFGRMRWIAQRHNALAAWRQSAVRERLSTTQRSTCYTSGSTLIACEKAVRQVRLVELDPKYVDTIILRWQEFSGGAAVLDGDGRGFEDIAAGRETSGDVPSATEL
jgi:hypothetical protein